MPADNTAHLAVAARRRHELTRAKAIPALRELTRTGTPVSFELVASTAGTSRSWLYSQPDIRDQIQHLRNAAQRALSSPVPPVSEPPAHPCCTGCKPPANETGTLPRKTRGSAAQFAEALGQLRMPDNHTLR